MIVDIARMEHLLSYFHCQEIPHSRAPFLVMTARRFISLKEQQSSG
jgi:hypothetical protein